jgi:uncharacterized protein
MINSGGCAVCHIPRALQLIDIVKEKSVFLFGPLQTGKSHLIRHQFPDVKVFNLLDAGLYQRLNNDPTLIRRELVAGSPLAKIVVIDEIQRIPELLNEVHLMIEELGVKFILTGSSARGLKKKGVSLLAGRARSRTLHPFVRQELGDEFDLLRAINRGLIPSIYFSDSYLEDLQEYTGTYLREAIAAEGIARNIPAFSRFLEVAARCNGTMINYTNIASDAEVKRSTVVDYFQILLDTLVAFELPAWKNSVKRKAIGKSKFYFFDLGVVNSLCKNRNIEVGSTVFGANFEHFIFHELKSYCDYYPMKGLAYWRSKSQFEVDFILDGRVAVEVKAKKNPTKNDLKGIRALQEESLLERYIVVSLAEQKTVMDGITVYPYQQFLSDMWSGGI